MGLIRKVRSKVYEIHLFVIVAAGLFAIGLTWGLAILYFAAK